MPHVITLNLQILSEANTHQHFKKKSARVRSQREVVAVALHNYFMEHPKPSPPLRVTITRHYIKGQRDFDDDNLASGCKAIRDQVAKFFNINDSQRDVIRYEYAQQRDPAKIPYATITIAPMVVASREEPVAPAPRPRKPRAKKIPADKATVVTPKEQEELF